MKNIITRPCEPTDDPIAITDLIVATDDYIYPPMFRACPEEQYSFFAACMGDKASLFYYKNMFLAVDGEKIVGLIVAFCGEASLCDLSIIRAYRSASDIAYCDRHYFSLLFSEYKKRPDTLCISNVCIAPSYRGQGLGKQLLQDFLCLHDGKIELDVLCDNDAALHLYRKCGFSVLYDEEAFAFEPIPNFRSYRMARNP